VLTLRLPTYNTRTMPILVKGGAIRVFSTLSSWPVSKLLIVDRAIVTTTYTEDRSTHRINVGPALITASATAIADKRIAVFTELRLRKDLPSSRAVQAGAQYELFDPSGNLRLTFPATAVQISLDRQHSTQVFSSAFVLRAANGAAPPLGTYQVRLLLDGHVARALSFTITN